MVTIAMVCPISNIVISHGESDNACTTTYVKLAYITPTTITKLVCQKHDYLSHGESNSACTTTDIKQYGLVGHRAPFGDSRVQQFGGTHINLEEGTWRDPKANAQYLLLKVLQN